MSWPVLLRRTDRMLRSCSVRSLSLTNSKKLPPRRGDVTLIRTLDPKRLQREDFVDLSHRLRRGYGIPSVSSNAMAVCGYTSSEKRDPFPGGTRGFFYYHPPTPPDTILGEVRFRVTASDDPASFSTGSDLIGPGARPWRVPPSVMSPTVRSGAAFGQLLLAEKLVTQAQLDLWTQLPRENSDTVPLLTHFGQPFFVDFSRPHVYNWVVTAHGVRKCVFFNRLFSRLAHKYGPSLTGTLSLGQICGAHVDFLQGALLYAGRCRHFRNTRKGRSSSCAWSRHSLSLLLSPSVNSLSQYHARVKSSTSEEAVPGPLTSIETNPVGKHCGCYCPITAGLAASSLEGM
ncbi:hypothetical protein BV25DRAFT_1822876 [Artomyces pyxidatus]|uniref:Uncharacterized protein n=1 Tax=Artomyces pyxidatus TaxID=48021 RepID=A0ACB8T7V2_9AGAM|nr:hypothetical protein BV25DRAFT_1822876 [Artomyces pyxidatus]